MANAIDWFGDDTTAAQAERFAALYDIDAPHGPDPAIDWFRAIARRTGGPVLELGCGTGRVAIPLAQDGHDVVGLDRSEAMLARAQRHLAHNDGEGLRSSIAPLPCHDRQEHSQGGPACNGTLKDLHDSPSHKGGQQIDTKPRQAPANGSVPGRKRPLFSRQTDH